MGFRDYWAAIRDRVDAGIDAWIPELANGLAHEQSLSIRRALKDGKRLRGTIVCLTCEALGGPIEEGIPRAVAIECIQAASLIHDDYVDKDTIRRHRPAIWTLEGCARPCCSRTSSSPRRLNRWRR
ncbi:MAG: polyprenyl synthetase family protein [Pseudomonadota bacterium]